MATDSGSSQSNSNTENASKSSGGLSDRTVFDMPVKSGFSPSLIDADMDVYNGEANLFSTFDDEISSSSQNILENKTDTKLSSVTPNDINSFENASNPSLSTGLASTDLSSSDPVSPVLGTDIDAKNKAYGEIKAQEKKLQQDMELKAKKAQQRAEEKAQAAQKKQQDQLFAQARKQPAYKMVNLPAIDEVTRQENKATATYLTTKSSETSGLLPVYDRFYRENPKAAEANLNNLMEQTAVMDPKVGQHLAEVMKPMQQKYRYVIYGKTAENNRINNRILSLIRSGDVRQTNQAIKEITAIRSKSETDYKALSKEARLSYEAYQMKHRTHAPNFFDDTPEDIKYKNRVMSQERGKEAAGSLYSSVAAQEELTDLAHKFTIGLSLLNGDNPDYAKFDQEMKKIQSQVPDIYRNTSTFQGGKELSSLLTTGLETVPGLGGISSAGDTARELAKAGLSLNAQRVGAGIIGLSGAFGGKLASKGANYVLLKSFGKDLEKLSSAELQTLNEMLFDEGVKLTVDGIKKMVVEKRHTDTQDDD